METTQPPRRPPADDLDLLERLAATEGASFVRELALSCGGLEALASLTADPVPPDPFDWTQVEPDDRPVVESILDAVEQVAELRLDQEYLGMVRRLVAMAASHPTAPLRRRSSPTRIGAALVWLLLRGNDKIGRGHHMIAGEDVWFWFGETSCADIGRKVGAAMGFVPGPGEMYYFHDLVALGDVRLLHSSTRRLLLSRRAHAVDVAMALEAAAEANKLVQHRPDGTVRIQASETGVVGAIKAMAESGRARITLLFGASMDDPSHALALSIPDARALVHSLQRALDAPMPS